MDSRFLAAMRDGAILRERSARTVQAMRGVGRQGASAITTLSVMAPYRWPLEPQRAASALHEPGGTGAGEAAAYASWAAWSVDSLHYLLDLDHSEERARWIREGYDTDTVDLTHVRWATSTSMTALDLGAAALGLRHRLPARPNRVHDVEDLRRGREQLCDGCAKWLENVLTDPEYLNLKQARDRLVHRRLPRLVQLTTEGATEPPERLGLNISGQIGAEHAFSSHELVELARDVATRHVTALLLAADARWL